MILFGIFFVLLSCSSEGTNTSNFDGLTDMHYISVVNMYFDEKHARIQLEQTVHALQQTVSEIKHDQALNSATVQNCVNLSSKCDAIINRHELDLKTMQMTIKTLQNNITDILTENNNLKQELNVIKQKSMAVDSLPNLQTKLQTMSKDIVTLNSKSEARVREFQLLLDKTNLINDKIDLAGRTFNQSIQIRERHIIEYCDAKIKRLGIRLSSNITNIELTLAQDRTKVIALEKGLNQVQQARVQTATQDTTKVSLTVQGGDPHFYNYGEVVKFPRVITALGVTNKTFNSSGIFITENAGLYLIAYRIRAWNAGSSLFAKRPLFEVCVFQNSLLVFNLYISTYESEGEGTAVITTELKLGDTIYIKVCGGSKSIGPPSSLTIVKI